MPDVKHFAPAVALGTVTHLFWRHGLATVGIQEVVRATGVNRSSLYATFGGKQELYLAALDRHLDEYALPGFQRLAEDPRGLPAIGEFFAQLIRTRCTGERARWGRIRVNAHAGPESSDPQVRTRLNRHHDRLRASLRDTLTTAR
jgi:TetR/AcrR family transcriptional repressor of nem operon